VLVVSALSIRDVAHPFLERVAEASGEVCLLMRYMNGKNSVMLEDSVDGPHPLRYSMNLYEPLSVLWGATGRSVLAFLRDDEIASALDAAENSPATGQAPPSLETLKEDLAAIRRQGYAMTFGQKIPGAVGFGVPVRDMTGRVFGSLCVTIPQLRFEPSQESAISALLLSEASALSNALGYTPQSKANAKRESSHG
jgi:DNA-binding IclR family transcriptional regulator